MMFREDKYFYAKERSKFGRQCSFVDHNELLFDEPSNPAYMAEYFLKNPVDRGTQLHKIYALSECLTMNPEMKGRGMNHYEGGWPKDLNPLDEEQTTRQRKKIMRDDIWAQKMPDLMDTMEKSVLQNGTCNIYEKYFEGLDGIPPREEFSGKTVNIFKDKKSPVRPISSLTWSFDGLLMGGSYSIPKFTETSKCDPTSFLWNIENNNIPFLALTPKAPIMSLQYNPRDQFILAGGLLTGEISIWDQRTGGIPTIVTEREITHTDRVNSLLWASSKSNSEFFSGSSDGTVYFWDIRNMVGPIDQLYLDPVPTNDQETSRSYGVSIVEFEPTIPTRFMVGSDQGFVFTCNRKGRTPIEKIMAKFKTNTGCIYSLERNPAFPKNFLTVGDWSVKIWSDEWRDAAIIWTTNENIPVLSGAWSKTRSSLFFITKHDGLFEGWDLLIEQDNPIVRIKLGTSPMLCCAAHENGALVAVAGVTGTIYLVRVSDNMVASSKVERPTLSLMMDRETRREKAYDSRLREVKLKIRQEQLKAEEMEAKEAEMAAKEGGTSSKEKNDGSEAAKEMSEEEKKKHEEEEKKKKEAEEQRRKEAEEKKEKEAEEKKKKEAQEAAKPATTDAASPTEQTSVVPHGPPPPSSIPEDEEVVVDLVEADEKEYYAQLEKEINKRAAVILKPVLTPFDPNFDKTTIMTPEQMVEEHRMHINNIKTRVIRGLLNNYRQRKLHSTEYERSAENTEEAE